MTAPRFTLAALERANAEWGCSCGPASFAVICGLTLFEARLYFPGFRGWCNPTMMIAAVDRVTPSRRSWTPSRDGHGIDWPRHGLARIQWEGPWMAPGVPVRARYRYTHWVGVRREGMPLTPHIWDINALQDPCDGWMPVEMWRESIVPLLTADIKRASGGWHITHAIEVAR